MMNCRGMASLRSRSHFYRQILLRVIMLTTSNGFSLRVIHACMYNHVYVFFNIGRKRIICSDKKEYDK
jgi:hypothetical protein